MNTRKWRKAKFIVKWMDIMKGAVAYVTPNLWWEKDHCYEQNFCVLLKHRLVYLSRAALTHYVKSAEKHSKERPKADDQLKTRRLEQRIARREWMLEQQKKKAR